MTINDEYFCLQDFIFKTIHEYIREEYWKISERNIKLEINLLNHPLNWYKMDSIKHSKQLIFYFILLLSNNNFFDSKSSSLYGRQKFQHMTQVSPPSSVSPKTALNIVLRCKHGTHDVCTVNEVHKYHCMCKTMDSVYIAIETHQRIFHEVLKNSISKPNGWS